MRESAAKVIIIPAKPEAAAQQTVKRQLRVAAYCRVSTDDEEQLTSYEAQQNYYGQNHDQPRLDYGRNLCR